MGMFTPATREKLKLRLALDGPAGSGKSYTALRTAFAIAGAEGRVAIIDTEHGSASKYEGDSPDGVPWKFDVCEPQNFAPTTYTAIIKEAGQRGYDVLIIDGLSHAWVGKGGALELVDRHAAKPGTNSFTAWREVTPMHAELIETMLACPCHLIVTMRTKMEYVVEENEKGKMVPRKVGTKPIQREGLEYEFDVVADMDHTHTLVVSKSRCPAIDEARIVKPTAEWIKPVMDWLSQGADPVLKTEFITVTPDKPINNRCTLEMVRRLVSIAHTAGMSQDHLVAAIAKRGVVKATELTIGQCEGLIAAIEAKSSSQADGRVKSPF